MAGGYGKRPNIEVSVQQTFTDALRQGRGDEMTHLGGLLAGIAAMIGAVIGMLTYLDSSGRFENPVGKTIIEVVSRDSGDNGKDGNNHPTPSTLQTDSPAVESLNVDADGCDITVEWVAKGDSNGRLELLRSGVLIDELLVGSGSREEWVLDIFGEGTYGANYELVAYDAEDRETDRKSASAAGVCIG